MSGALSATTNQVSWLYSGAKDTQAMIDLVEILFNQYPFTSRIFDLGCRFLAQIRIACGVA